MTEDVLVTQQASRAAEASSCTGTTARPPDAPSGGYVRLGKPLVDRVVAGLALVLLLPVLLLVAAAVLLTLGRPVLFRQERIGLHGQPFPVLKFRTMRPDRRRTASDYQGPDRRQYHKSEADPRHTRLGRLLRSTSLDELPQLLNVVRGQMSLVGPRPELPHVVQQYEHWQHRRHDVRPGLTGLWQITARGQGPMHEHAHLDIAYVDSVSPRTDVRILASTLPALLRRTGG